MLEHQIGGVSQLHRDTFEFAGCAYFAARELAMDAEIVFCPYSYIVDPIIRAAVEADIRGSIIIFDEAQYVHV
jgi:Fanconi anemia group J protein